MTSDPTYPALPLKPAPAWKALAALCIGFFMILLDQTIVAVATPDFQRDLGASYNEVIWVTSIYLLFFAVPLLVTGRLGDRFGQRNIYIIGMVIFTIASLACGLSTTVEWLIISRAIQGLGAALLTPQTMSVINRIFPREKRGAALGVWGATAGLSTMLGPILGGVITSALSWQWIFLVNVPFGILSIALVAIWVPRFRPTERPIDGPSIVLSVVAVSLIIFGVQEGESNNWSWWIWALIVVGFIVGFLFYRRQAFLTSQDANDASSREPLLPTSLFATRSFFLGNVGIFTMGFCMASFLLPLMMYLQQVHELSAMAAVLLILPMSVLSLIMSPLVGFLVDRVDARPIAIIGFVLMVLGTGVLVFFVRPGLAAGWVLLPMAILGFANSAVWAPNSAMTLRDLPDALAGAGSGAYNMIRQVGSVTGAAVVGAVLQIRLAAYADQPDQMAAAFGQSMIPVVVVLVIGVIAVAFSETAPPGAAIEPLAGADGAAAKVGNTRSGGSAN